MTLWWKQSRLLVADTIYHQVWTTKSYKCGHMPQTTQIFHWKQKWKWGFLDLYLLWKKAMLVYCNTCMICRFRSLVYSSNHLWKLCRMLVLKENAFKACFLCYSSLLGNIKMKFLVKTCCNNPTQSAELATLARYWNFQSSKTSWKKKQEIFRHWLWVSENENIHVIHY